MKRTRRAASCEGGDETSSRGYGIIGNLNERSGNATAERLAVGVRVAGPIDEVSNGSHGPVVR